MCHLRVETGRNTKSGESKRRKMHLGQIINMVDLHLQKSRPSFQRSVSGIGQQSIQNKQEITKSIKFSSRWLHLFKDYLFQIIWHYCGFYTMTTITVEMLSSCVANRELNEIPIHSSWKGKTSRVCLRWNVFLRRCRRWSSGHRSWPLQSGPDVDSSPPPINSRFNHNENNNINYYYSNYYNRIIGSSRGLSSSSSSSDDDGVLPSSHRPTIAAFDQIKNTQLKRFKMEFNGDWSDRKDQLDAIDARHLFLQAQHNSRYVGGYGDRERERETDAIY